MNRCPRTSSPILCRPGLPSPSCPPAHSWAPCCRPGAAQGLVVSTGGRTEFGAIAAGLGEDQPQTEFQVGLSSFSLLLLRVAAVLPAAAFIINVAKDRPLIEALLLSLSIAVGITPQLRPAVVSTSLTAGSRRLARQKVLVKRLVCIEDLGDVQVLCSPTRPAP